MLLHALVALQLHQPHGFQRQISVFFAKYLLNQLLGAVEVLCRIDQVSHGLKISGATNMRQNVRNPFRMRKRVFSAGQSHVSKQGLRKSPHPSQHVRLMRQAVGSSLHDAGNILVRSGWSIRMLHGAAL